jgi:hypothetical protein
MAVEIDETFYYWGPFLWKTKVDKDFCSELLKRSKNTNVKFNKSLAGHIDEEYKYLEKDKEWFVNKMAPYLDRYLKSGAHWYKQYLEKEVTKISLDSLWINFMKKGDYNPKRTHNHDISFVLYLKIPEVLREENKKLFESSTPNIRPGCIEFFYGEEADTFITSHVFLPEETDLFIFPSKLRHLVAPFKSNCVRVSVSGNFKIEKE